MENDVLALVHYAEPKTAEYLLAAMQLFRQSVSDIILHGGKISSYYIAPRNYVSNNRPS